MSGAKRVGRPMKNKNKVEVSNSIIELLSKNADICYV
jgi:hypothetical protein